MFFYPPTSEYRTKRTHKKKQIHSQTGSLIHAMDFSFPLVDSIGLYTKTRQRICLEVRALANNKAKSKSENVGRKQDQEKRATIAL